MEQSLPTPTITLSEFQAMSAEWTAIDTEYDALFQDFLDNPRTKTPEELAKFRAMHHRLYEIENELYKIAEGIMVIQD
jgi:hypothetical protein